MSPPRRFQAEYFIRSFLKELSYYASVFESRISNAFDGLDEEAERVQNEAYDRFATSNPYAEDDSRIAEAAHEEGIDFYIATDAVRQGLFNLMIAGLFHMLEQQAQYLATRAFSNRPIPPEHGGFDQLKGMLKKEFGIDIESFKCWPQLKELRLVANVVKHGDGRSGEELKKLNLSLFNGPHNPLPVLAGLPLRPLVGEGLRLGENHFKQYKQSVEQFWEELIEALLPVFCPKSE